MTVYELGVKAVPDDIDASFQGGEIDSIKNFIVTSIILRSKVGDF